MNNLNDSKPSQKLFLIALLGILLVGIPLTVTALQGQQIFKQFAWSTQQSASAVCNPEKGNASIQVTFTNTEASKSMDVTAKDLQTGKSISLGTIKPKQTVTEKISTEEESLKAGSVLFSLEWTNGSNGKDSRTASYKKLDSCTPPPPFCPKDPDIKEGKCSWEPLEGAAGYEIEVINTESGDVVKAETLPETASESAFTMEPGIGYKCSVTPINACGKGVTTRSEEKICKETPPEEPVCPKEPQKYAECSWDTLNGADEYNVTIKEATSGTTIKSDTVKAPIQKISYTADPDKTYICTVTASNKCSESPPVDSPPTSCTVPTLTPTIGPSPTVTPKPSPTPLPSPSPTVTPTVTPTPTPTVTPVPTATPKPQATPTPYVVVRIPPNVVPPQTQVVVQQPPQTQVVQQQQPPQVVVQQPPQTQVVQQTVQTTPAPTIKPTGNLSNSLILVGASSVLLIIGSVLFFLL